MTQFHHGITAREALIGKIPLRNADTNTIAMLAFADDADENIFPLNTPVLVTSINRVLSKAGTQGNLRKNLEIISAITSPTLVVIRIDNPFGDGFDQLQVIGTTNEDGKRTGLQALLTVKSVLGITPKIICVSDTESIDVANALGAICKKLRAYSYITPRDEDGEILQNAEAVSAYREMLAFREIELICPEWTSGNVFSGVEKTIDAISVGISPDLQYEDDWTENEIHWAIEVNGTLYPTEIGSNEEYSYLEDYLQENKETLGITGEYIDNDDDSSAVYMRNITNTRKFVRLIPDEPYMNEMKLIGNPSAKIDSEGVISFWLEANNEVEPEKPYIPPEGIMALRTSNEVTEVTLQLQKGTHRIDWGDGTIEEQMNGLIVHEYATASEWIILVEKDSSEGGSEGKNTMVITVALGIKEVIQWWSEGYETLGFALNTEKQEHLIKVPTAAPRVFALEQNGSSPIFLRCTRLNDLNVLNWDTSLWKNFEFFFDGCLKFNQPIGLHWDFSNAETLLAILQNCKEYNQPWPNFSTVNIPDPVSGLGTMFNGASSLDQDFSKWCVPNVPTEPGHFAWESKMKPEHMPIWGTCSGVMPEPWPEGDPVIFIASGLFYLAITTASGTVSYAIDHGDGKIIKYRNTSAGVLQEITVPDMSVVKLWIIDPVDELLLSQIVALTEWGDTPISSFVLRTIEMPEYTERQVPTYLPTYVKNTSGMFNSAVFNDDINMWDVSNVENMKGMFAYNSSFNKPLNLWNVRNVKDMEEMFRGSVFNQDISGWCVPLITSEPSSFSGSALVEEHKPRWGTCPTVIADPSVFEFTSKAGGYQYHGAVGDKFTFSDGSTYLVDAKDVHYVAPAGRHSVKLVNDPLRPKELSIAGVIELHSFPALELITTFSLRTMYDYSTGLIKAPTYLPPNLTDISQLFYDCDLFKGLEIAGWDTKNVTRMTQIFNSCSKFVGDISNWNTSNVTNMKGMFSGCKSFNIDISNWDVGNVTSMEDIFSECTEFNSPLNNWDVSKTTNTNDMFYSARSFNQPLNNWNVSTNINMGGMFKLASSFKQDISGWCVSNIPEAPKDFALGIEPHHLPQWGTCPNG